MDKKQTTLTTESNLTFEDMAAQLPGVKLSHGVYGNITKLTLCHGEETAAEVFYDESKERFIYSGAYDDVLCQDLARTYQTHIINFSGVQEFVNPEYSTEDMKASILEDILADHSFS